MLVQIGSSKESEDVVDLLLQCHQRIRHFLGLASRLAQRDTAYPKRKNGKFGYVELLYRF
jgi:hypothetical protein